MFGWIPLIGPVIDGIVSIWKGQQNVEVQKYKLDTEEDIAKVQAQTQIVESFKDSIDIRLCRDIVLVPSCIWTGIAIWDHIVVLNHPWLVFGVKDFQGTLQYLPYAILAFLFGNAWMLKK